MTFATERRLLQCAVAVLALVPIGAGLAGIVAGPDFTAPAETRIPVDSHFRYLSGLLLGIGLAFWSFIPGIENRTGPVRLLTAIVFIGGLARLSAVVTEGLPGSEMTFALIMELVMTPLLCAWQARLAHRAAQTDSKNN